jgi:rubrerythrin
MNPEQKKVLEGFKLALRIENEGKEYYKNSIKDCSSPLSKDLLDWLMNEEEKHKKRLEQLYETILKNQGWPNIPFNMASDNWLKTTFKSSLMNSSYAMECKSDKYIMDKAMELEDKSYLMYLDGSQAAASDVEKTFYENMASEERSHYLALVDYKEYLIDPSGYFVKTERHSLDGA